MHSRLLFFLVYFGREPLLVALIRLCMPPGDWIWNNLIEIVLLEWVGAKCVGHEGGVVCGAEKLIKNFEGFVFLLLRDLNGFNVILRKCVESNTRIFLLCCDNRLIIKHANAGLYISNGRHVAVRLCTLWCWPAYGDLTPKIKVSREFKFHSGD